MTYSSNKSCSSSALARARKHKALLPSQKWFTMLNATLHAIINETFQVPARSCHAGEVFPHRVASLLPEKLVLGHLLSLKLFPGCPSSCKGTLAPAPHNCIPSLAKSGLPTLPLSPAREGRFGLPMGPESKNLPQLLFLMALLLHKCHPGSPGCPLAQQTIRADDQE